MTNSRTYTGIGALATVLVIAGLLFYAQMAEANPPSFSRSQTAEATTTVTYMSAGTATTTLIHDFGAGNPLGGDSAALAIIFNASSTASTLGWRFEYAHDTPGYNCKTTPDACAWYSEDIVLGGAATSSVHVRTAAEHLWLFASSTIGSAINPSDRGQKIVSIVTPTRYVRAVFFMPVGSTRGSLWAEFIGKEQIN